MKIKLVQIVTFSIFMTAIVAATWASVAVMGSLAGTQAVQETAIETPAIAVEAPAQPVVRFATVEDYFKEANPNPLSYRVGEPLFTRDVSNSRKTAIRERDGNCCLVCGSTQQLEVDHKIALMNGGNNEDSNLGTLCDPCHVEKTRYDWSIKRKRRKMKR